MSQIILPPERPTGLRALLSIRRAKPVSSSHAEPFRIRPLLDPKQLSHADIRERCSHYIAELFQPIAPHERSNKALFRKVARVTGLGMQRIERLWRRYIAKPGGLELAVLGTAYVQHLEKHRKAAASAPAVRETPREESTLGSAVDYSASRWHRAEDVGREDRARRSQAPATKNAN